MQSRSFISTTEPLPRWSLSHADGADLLKLDGDWMAASGAIPSFPPAGLAHDTAMGPLRFDSASLGRWDSALIAFLWDAKCAATNAGRALDTNGLPPAVGKLLGLLPEQLSTPAPKEPHGFRPLNWLGAKTLGVLAGTGLLSALFAATVRAGVSALFGRARMRPTDLAANLRDAGPQALVIVSVVNFLIGAILAFVGAVQLRKFAADSYVADLVSLALVREMAAVMTAIVIAGRTGGAYAARIATMQGSEEIDALTVIGIPVVDYVILPAVLALVFTMPLLYLYGCVVGMLGGFVVALSMLNVTGVGYLNQTLDALTFDQFEFGLAKSVAFAAMIGVSSCWIGLRAGRSAADVGIAATRAVVAGIVGVIAMDAAFAVAAELLGI